MPKMKTHSGTAKRFRVTGSGKIMRSKAYKSHIMTKKSQKRNVMSVTTPRLHLLITKLSHVILVFDSSRRKQVCLV